MKTFILLLLSILVHLPTFASNTTQTVISAQQLQEDFTQLYDDLKASHINLFANVTREEYDNKYAQIAKKLKQPLTQIQAHILFQTFVAFGEIAHANIAFPTSAYEYFRNKGGKSFPIYVEIQDKNWFVAEDYSSHSLPKGTQILTINQIPVSDWLKKLHQYISADTPAIAASLLEFQLPQYLWLHFHNMSTIQERVKITALLNGKEITREILFISRETLQNRIDQNAKSTSNDAPKLRDYRILSKAVAYIKPGPFYNAETPTDVWNNVAFVNFIDEAFGYFNENDVTKLLIDVRNNPGGTNSFSDPLIAWFADKPFKFASSFLIRSSFHAEQSNKRRLDTSAQGTDAISQQLAEAYKANPPGSNFDFEVEEVLPNKGKRFNGDVYVLIDRTSYSNAVSLAAIVKDYGFGTVIGESSVDYATTYASMETFTLTHSKIKVGFPKAHIIRPSGDTIAGPVHPDIILSEVTIDAAVRKILSN
ncbi:S41 family peptidase [Glaciecola petra]|uniref:S41 family peptidase n=1 Tax=Glaciecola petra TaxID=3075602 RepID=A0ABU2ZR41_9ALTE|nr:S41 family peptidase [Aestuariibacter sp. P117]MDT0595097.1 S41 family peptidase [Aestuariibacter sp. P117]